MSLNVEIRTDKEIVLTDEISKSVTKVSPYRVNDRIWLAIDAPKHIRIDHRKTQGVCKDELQKRN